MTTERKCWAELSRQEWRTTDLPGQPSAEHPQALQVGALQRIANALETIAARLGGIAVIANSCDQRLAKLERASKRLRERVRAVEKPK